MPFFGGGLGKAIAGALSGAAGGGGLQGAILGGALGLLSGFGEEDKPKPPKIPQIERPKIPSLPEDRTDFKSVRPQGALNPPNALSLGGGFSSQMTPLQQRSSIATQATSGGGGAYTDPAVQDYYRNLALQSLTSSSGRVQSGAFVLPIERQYLSTVFGVEPRNQSVSSFLSALLRA